MRMIGIEALLSWAYRDELPKAARETGRWGPGGYGGGWDAVSRHGEVMAEMVSDGRPNAYGVLPCDAWYGAPPHADALAVHAAVTALAACAVTVPADWSPLGGLGLSASEQSAAVARAAPRVFVGAGEDRRLRFDLPELVRRYAILGGAPAWEAEPPRARFVEVCGRPAWFRRATIRGAFDERVEVEVDGYDARRGRPYPDAYRKTVLTPDPALIVVDRAEHEAWRAALDSLTQELRASGALIAHAVTGSARPLRPWQD